MWGDSTTTAYKAWEKANKSKDNGKLDAKNVTALAKKYKAKVNTVDPYTRYFSQPTSADYVVAAKMADNAKVSQFNGYLSTIMAGSTLLYTTPFYHSSYQILIQVPELPNAFGCR